MAGQYAYYPANNGVTTINGILGAVTLAAGPNISITEMGQTITISGQPGTVTSVGLALPSIFTVTGSPVTSSGTLTGTLNTQTANSVFAGPATGAAAMPTFRALVAADIPSLSGTYVTQSEVGAPSGVASLDAGGKVPLSQLPATLMEFQGNWNPTTNTPTLVDGTGTTGFTYWVSAAFAGPVAGLTDPSMHNFQIGDLVIYNGTHWVLVTPAAGVQSVNGAQGAVTVNAINQLTGDVTTTAAAGSQSKVASLVATTNSTLTTLSALSLPYSQVTGGPSGTVTAVSVASANGFAGTSSGGATPALTLSTTVTGILYGNGTSVATAVAGNFPTLNQSTTGTAANITATSNSTLTTLSALSLPTTQLSGQVTLAQLPTIAADTILGNNTAGSATPTALTATQVTAMLNLFSSSLQGLTPASGGGTTTFLRADGTWATPPGTGGSGTVTSVAITAPTFLTVTGSPITTSGTIALSLNTAPLPVVNGGTGSTTPLTQYGILYAANSGAIATTAAGAAGFVLTSNGVSAPTYQDISGNSSILKAPTIQKFITAGSGTYTAPVGPAPLYIKVRMVGGGGGGGGGGTGSPSAGGTGSASTFGTSLLSAGGGGGGSTAAGSTPGVGGTSSLGAAIGTALTGGSGDGGTGFNITGYESGMSGASSFFGGSGAGAANAAGGSGASNTGAGGAGGGVNAAGQGTGGGGGSGGYVEAIIAPVSTTYSWTVGSPGNPGSSGTNGFNGGQGGSGYIEVTEYYQ